MAFYREFVLPPLCDLAMRARRLQPYRERVAGQAAGRVLEIGAGSGVNLSLYRNADEVLALEPDPKLVEMAKSKAQAAPRHVSFLQASAEHIPLPDSVKRCAKVTPYRRAKLTPLAQGFAVARRRSAEPLAERSA